MKIGIGLVGVIAGGILALNAGSSVAKPQAPEFIGGKAEWLNSAPISLREALRTHKTPDGKPVRAVLVDFWEYTCINCIRTLPYLKEWNARYAKDGLLIVGIHTPEFSFAGNRQNVVDAVQRFGIKYPVLVDSSYSNWNAYGNQYWPMHYLIDGSGRIVETHPGEGDYAETEARIQYVLKESDPSLKFPGPMLPVRGTDKPGAVCYPTTPEVYVGYERGSLTNKSGYEKESDHAYANPGEFQDGVVSAVGNWHAGPESMTHVGTSLSDSLGLQYHALEIDAVIKPDKTAPFRVWITQDGKPVAKVDKGADLQYDDQGRSYVNVTAPRLYTLVQNAKYGTHKLTLSSDSDSFSLFSFTFGSCEES